MARLVPRLDLDRADGRVVSALLLIVFLALGAAMLLGFCFRLFVWAAGI